MSGPLRILQPSEIVRTDGAWLTPLAGHWIDTARAQLSQHAAVVRVTVATLRGSAPREPGASMVVVADGTVGTIGGGQLEWRATAAARELLSHAGAAVRITDLVLGPDLGQCCGGRVALWLERLTRNDLPWLSAAARRMRQRHSLVIVTEFTSTTLSRRFLRSSVGVPGVALRRLSDTHVTLLEELHAPRPHLWIFGAGHVGQAVVRLLAELALFDIDWIDSRADLLPANLPEGVTGLVCAAPPQRVAAAPPGTRYLVLTHDHALDYELCRVILSRADAAWLGLIGSASKSARFRSRLLRDGLDRAAISGLTCPIGIRNIPSKLPGAIAIAIAAQLLQRNTNDPPELSIPSAQHVTAAQGLDCSGPCNSCGSERRQTP